MRFKQDEKVFPSMQVLESELGLFCVNKNAFLKKKKEKKKSCCWVLMEKESGPRRIRDFERLDMGDGSTVLLWSSGALMERHFCDPKAR